MWQIFSIGVSALLAFSSPTAPTASPGVHVCNGSQTMSVKIAKAWQRGYAGNYVVSGWFELQPAPIKLFGQCSTTGAGFTSPSYVLVAHLDESDWMAVYRYAFESFGNSAQEVNRPLCVALGRAFTLEAADRDGLANCPEGMVKAPFTLRINAPSDDSDITLYVAEAGQPAEKLGTLEELSRGGAPKPPSVEPKTTPPLPAARPATPPDLACQGLRAVASHAQTNFSALRGKRTSKASESLTFEVNGSTFPLMYCSLKEDYALESKPGREVPLLLDCEVAEASSQPKDVSVTKEQHAGFKKIVEDLVGDLNKCLGQPTTSVKKNKYHDGVMNHSYSWPLNVKNSKGNSTIVQIGLAARIPNAGAVQRDTQNSFSVSASVTNAD